ncbi:CYP63 cytochrome P450 monooxygenase-like protein [Fomitiporia mediterranea MF3/22]|uniref:CYP63 cytochrome P450 monooxygenase-like protein n=1 Tax=Fomitiporia mediterranea (strain MF3/22) TaxID=694068 RepID=UPI0004408EAE|nr:CYP63 cytochrome P450 monooxygenase-like protein [Fomitiporia mediterranea MF3/22]EJD03501.1 CYP63 cytochrome P450 monooxygenase-like protein [Fomitiporia mediterranea MF3/22]
MCSPGLKLLLATLPTLLKYFVAIALLYYGTLKYFDFELRWPLYCKVLASLGLIIASTLVQVKWGQLRNKWAARRLGAVLPPVIKGRLPGNVDTLRTVFEHERTGYTGDFLLIHIKDLGWTFNWRIFGMDDIVTVEPEHIKAILATEFDNFERGDTFKDVMQSVLGDGVFNADGDMWKFHRSMTRPFFSRDRISHFEIFGRHADEAVALLNARMREGQAVDIQDLVGRFTLDSATEFLFGHCVHVLRAGLPYSPNLTLSQEKNEQPRDTASVFAEAFKNAQLVVALRSRVGDLWPLFEFWKDKTKDSMKIVDAFIEPILQDAVAKRKGPVSSFTSKKEIEEGETLLDHLINFTSDTKILKDEIINIMIAGRDTTAATLTFAMYCLAMYPNVMKRLRDEILSVVGKERNPTYGDLKEMKYLRAFINEVLRLYPPVPFNMRQSIKATTLPNKTPGARPWYVPAHCGISYSVLLMHRRADLWGPDAHEFDPDRFLDYRLHKYLTPNPFIFLPFNAGPRICLGQQFAYNEVGFMLIRLLQAFDNVSLAEDAQPEDSLPPPEWTKAVGERKSVEKLWPKSHLTLYIKGGLWIRLHEAPAHESV